MSDTVQFSVVSDPDKWEPTESFQCASQEDAIKAAALFKELHGVIERQAARIKELEKDAAFRLEASSRETEEARFYRYLRDEAGQSPDDHDGPMICSGLGDNFDYLRGEECDKEIRAAIDAAMEADK